MNNKELRKLIREISIDKLEDLFYKLIKQDIRILVRRWGGFYMYIDDISIFDDKSIKCYESPNWSVSFRSKKEFSYNVKLEKEAKEDET